MNPGVVFIVLALSILKGAGSFAGEVLLEDCLASIEIEANHEDLFNLVEIDSYMKNDVIMLPLRKMGERLGYKVNWNKKLGQVDISKMGLTTSVKPGKNIYFRGEDPPIKLSNPPSIKRGTSYVPFEFFQEILGEEIFISGNKLVLLTSDREDEQEEMEVSGFVKEVRRDGNNTSILIEVAESEIDISELLIHVHKDSEFYQEGNRSNWNDIKVGSGIRAVTPRFMTMSLPAQTIGEKIFLEDFIWIEEVFDEGVNYPLIRKGGGQGFADSFNRELTDILKELDQKEIYVDLNLGYQISLLNQDFISIIFTGDYSFMGERRQIIETLNMDLETGRKIGVGNYFKNDKKSKEQLEKILAVRVEEEYGKKLQTDQLFMYFIADDLVVYYYDDSPYRLPIEIYLEKKAVEGLVNEDFIR